MITVRCIGHLLSKQSLHSSKHKTPEAPLPLPTSQLQLLKPCILALDEELAFTLSRHAHCHDRELKLG